MKKHKRVIIKNSKLKNVRYSLRTVIAEAYFEINDKLLKEKREIRKKFIEKGKSIKSAIEATKELESKIQQLSRTFEKSICICGVCRKMDKDMVYATRPKEWFCIDCYENKIPKNLQEAWEPKYPLTEDQVIEFLKKLKKVSDQCETTLKLSKQILADMGIKKKDQNIFLDILYQYGGHCDSEILMNAYPKIIADFDIDI